MLCVVAILIFWGGGVVGHHSGFKVSVKIDLPRVFLAHRKP